MSYPWKSLSPKDGFIVRQQTLLSDIDQKLLTFLYQPIIGPVAYSLFMTLWTEVEEESYWSETLLHSELLSLLNIGIPDFYQARVKLEAIGLIKTYLQTDPEKKYIYELYQPQDSESFFTDDLLSILLLEQIGERKFKTLRKRFAVKEVEPTFKNITKSFLDVFHFNTEKLSTAQPLLKESVSLATRSSTKEIRLEDNTFDWKFFFSGLHQQYVDQSAITDEVKELIITLHNLYNVDELAMQHYIADVSNLDTGEVDQRRLKKVVYDDFHRKNPGRLSAVGNVEESIINSDKSQSDYVERLKQQGFTDSDVNMIEVSSQFSPMEFITNIKQQMKGYVSRGEENVIGDLVKKSNLPTPVINILIHYVLIVQKNVMFDRNFAEKIANDWAQNEVTTPEEAMEKVKKFHQEKAEKARQQLERKQSTSPKFGYRNKPVRKETLPAWAKEDHVETKEEKATKEEQDAFLERLNRIRNKKKEGE